MKILMLTSYYYPRVGGVEKYVKKIADELKKRGYEIKIITKLYRNDLKEKEIVDGIEIRRVNFSGLLYIWKMWLYLWKNRKLLIEADAIHCHDVSTFYWYLPFRFLFWKKPVFITYYGYEKIPVPKGNILLRRISKLLTTSQINGGRYLEKYYKIKCDYVIYAATDIKLPKKEKILKRKNRIVYIGRLEKDTGVEGYIKALKILKEKYKINLQMDIYGEGSLRKQLEKLVKRDKLNVIFHGAVENASQHFKEVKFAFSTSPMATVEAMASRCLVFSLCENQITKDLLIDLTQKKNIIVIASSPEELAQRFYVFYHNQKIAENIISDAYKFAQKLTWEKMAKVFIEMYENFKSENS